MVVKYKYNLKNSEECFVEQEPESIFVKRERLRG